MQPKLSIITINLNNSAGLRKTIESVLSQSFRNFEFIVIDGGSTDESTEIIKNNAEHISYWVSESDKGIYAAMNKGIKKATGEYCLFLNSGDALFSNDVLANVFKHDPSEDFLYGNLSRDGAIVNYPDKLTPYFFVKGTLCHQVAFIKTKLFQTFGYYNEKLKLVADWEFFCKVLIGQKCSYKHFEVLVCTYDTTGLTSSPAFEKLLTAEREAVLKDLPQAFHNALLLRELFAAIHDFNKKQILSLLFRINWFKTDPKLSAEVFRKIVDHVPLFFRNISNRVLKKKHPHAI